MLKWLTNRHKGDVAIKTVHKVVEGEPQQTEHCTVEQLRRWNYIGIYVEVEETEGRLDD